jgi:nicotinamidase-related amidase
MVVMEKLSRRIVLGAAVLTGLSARASAAPPPRTLFDLSGIHPAPGRLGEATLIVIDAQGEYRNGPLRLDGMEPAMLVLAAILQRARSAGTPIVHIAHRGDAGGLFDRSRYGGRILLEAAPRAGEALVEKPLPNAFARTGLQARLEAIGRRKLIVVGFMTHMCVSSTVQAAFDLDYDVTVVADATATRALPSATGGRAILAAQIQAAALAALADDFAAITSSPSLLA